MVFPTEFTIVALSFIEAYANVLNISNEMLLTKHGDNEGKNTIEIEIYYSKRDPENRITV